MKFDMEDVLEQVFYFGVSVVILSVASMAAWAAINIVVHGHLP